MANVILLGNPPFENQSTDAINIHQQAVAPRLVIPLAENFAPDRRSAQSALAVGLACGRAVSFWMRSSDLPRIDETVAFSASLTLKKAIPDPHGLVLMAPLPASADDCVLRPQPRSFREVIATVLQWL